MMYEFWLPASALLLLACLIIIIPSLRFFRELRAPADIDKQRTEQNIAIYKERLSELEAERDCGAINDSQLSVLVAELDNTLLSDASELQASSSPSDAVNDKDGQAFHFRRVTPVLGLSILFVIGLSTALYASYGSYSQVISFKDIEAQNSQLANATEQAKKGDMAELLRQLHEKLKLAPENIEGWHLLARTAMNSERYSLAVEAFEQIISLLHANKDSDRAEIAATYGIMAQAQYYVSKGNLDADVKRSIDEALQYNPAEANALGLLAIDAFSSENFQLAIDKWQDILKAYPDHPAKASMQQGIDVARSKLGLANNAPSDSTGPQLNINVRLKPELAEQLGGDETLFIFVQNAAADASKVPLAASRHQVSELPLSILLSDANAMSPMAKISDARIVNVVARISKSGQPVASAGDIEGRISNVDIASPEQGKEPEHLSLVIEIGNIIE